MAAQKQPEINLIPQEELDSTTKGRVLRWLLGAFRYIVIVTELVVVFAFLSRFYFDSRIADLNDEIEQKTSYIQSQNNLQNDFLQKQNRLNIFGEMAAENKTVSPMLQDIVNRLPSDSYLTNLTLQSGNDAVVQAETFSERSMQQFLANLADSPYLENVALIQAESKAGSSEINFTISADMKGRQ